MDAPAPEGPDGLLWVQEATQRKMVVQFDLSTLPPGLQASNLVRCTLRLVAERVLYSEVKPNVGGSPVLVKGGVTGAGGGTIVSLKALTQQQTVALQTSEPLCGAIFEKYSSPNKVLSLTLFTESHKASSTFYSARKFDNPSRIPRLVIEYTLPPLPLMDSLSWPQSQQNPEHTGRNPWIPARAPTSFTIDRVTPPIPAGAGIAFYPVVYRGNIYLIYKTAETNNLICLDFTGKNKVWEKSIGRGTVQRSPVISRQGVLYVVTESQIAAFDLNRTGESAATPFPLSGKLSSFTDATVGNDGSLYLALKQNEGNYIYGFTARLAPFLQAGPFGTAQDSISTISVSPEGNKIFAQLAKGAIVIDVTNPSQQRTIRLRDAWEYFWTPVAGPAVGVMIFSDFSSTAHKANVRGYSTSEIWKSPGTLVPQPVLGSNEIVYFIQESKLQGHKYNQIGSTIITGGDGLKTTSNLVMDGANNIYFWDNGTFYGFTPDGNPLFPKQAAGQTVSERTGDGPERFIRLALAPDGTLWTNNNNANFLFAFQPVYAQPDLTVKGADLATQTAYRTAGKLTVEGGAVKESAQLLLEAGTSISFSGGFRVPAGASLLCRVGR